MKARKKSISEEIARQEAKLRELEAAHARRPAKVYLATLSATGLSAGMMAKGLFDKAVESSTAGVIGMGMAVASAVTATALLTTATMSLFGIAMDASRKQAFKVALLSTTLMVPTLGISTFYGVLGNAGEASLVYDMRDRAAAWQIYAETSMAADAAQAKSAADTLIPIRNDICDTAERERNNGLLSGSRGTGAISSGYARSCTNISSILDTLTQTATDTNTRRKEVMAIVMAMHAVPKNETLNVFERQDAFREQAVKLKEILSLSGTENVGERLKAQLAIMESSVTAMDVQIGSFGERQTNAIQGLRQSLNSVKETVSAFLSGTSSGSVASEPSAELPDMGAAVMTYWIKNLPQILMAVLVDFMPLYFCAMLMLSRSIPQARRMEMTTRRK